jgi:hypothetical protein
MASRIRAHAFAYFITTTSLSFVVLENAGGDTRANNLAKSALGGPLVPVAAAALLHLVMIDFAVEIFKQLIRRYDE